MSAKEKELAAAGAASALSSIALGEASIFAPLSGAVITKNIEPGSFVTNGTVAFNLANVDTVKFSFGVPDSVVMPMVPGAPMNVKVDAFPGKTFRGSITKIAAGANQDARTFQVEVKLQNPDHRLRVGMIASVQLDSGKSVTLTSVPLTALRSTQSGSDGFNVYCIEKQDGKMFAKLKYVRVKNTSGNLALLKSGLQPNDQVIVSPSNALADGMQVAVIFAQIGGLSIATFVTLGLVPIMYAICVLDLKWIKWE